MNKEMKKNNTNIRKSIKFFLIFMIVNIIFVYLYQYVFYDFGTYFLLIPIILVCTILMIICTIPSIRRKNYLLIILGILIILSNFLAILIRIPINNFESKQTEIKGLLIVNALDSYYKDHNEYPKNLDELEKDYLPQIPHPYKIIPDDSTFHYRRHENGEYSLAYYAHYYVDYDQRAKKWHPRPRHI